jgi:predicted RNA binding protein YcfA (HicA-like mRNA interferase family)
MPKPISRREFIRRLRILGWSGPFPRGKHMAMYHPDGRHVIIPNPHGGSDLDWSLTSRLLKQAKISQADLEAAN